MHIRFINQTVPCRLPSEGRDLSPTWASAFAGVTKCLPRFAGIGSAHPVNHVIASEH
jgi:hypothetical protein